MSNNFPHPDRIMSYEARLNYLLKNPYKWLGFPNRAPKSVCSQIMETFDMMGIKYEIWLRSTGVFLQTTV